MAKKKAKKSYTRQIKSINDRYRKTIGKISDKQEAVIEQILIIIQGYAAYYTPQDTNALINSQYRRMISYTGYVRIGRIGYTQAYAAAMHNKLGWNPRPPGSPGKRGGGYNPQATPKFLEKGAQEALPDIEKIIVSENKI